MHITFEELLEFDYTSLDISFYKREDFERRMEEQDNDFCRFPFWRDCQRLISTPAFRRLKGKTQLFPGNESDFFRCRLTHSQEVAHIGRTIAKSLNITLREKYKLLDSEKKKENENQSFKTHEYYSYIDLDLVEFACLAHDIGHPPFGHQGEQELNKLMSNYGGFEGNAQTLRIIACLEKKKYNTNIATNKNGTGFTQKGKDARLGINPTFRSVSSILKYDNSIPLNVKKVEKGYYLNEKELVDKTKEVTLNHTLSQGKKYKSIECQIMDIADDIAYSVYDLEDAFKGNFIQPLDFVNADAGLVDRIIDKISEKHFEYSDRWTRSDINAILKMIFNDIETLLLEENTDTHNPNDISSSYLISKEVANNGYLRADFTSQLISYFVQDIDINLNLDEPSQSKIHFKQYVEEDVENYTQKMYAGVNKSFLFIEVLKHFNYEFQINSSKLRIVEYRGKEIVRTIFEALDEHDGVFLPNDIRTMYELVSGSPIYEAEEKEIIKKRIICDFVAGMTDHYALEFYSRLKSENAKSIYKPM